jgi:hypothetical protein
MRVGPGGGARVRWRDRVLMWPCLNPSSLLFPLPQDRPAENVNSAAFHAVRDLLYTAGSDDNVVVYNIEVRERCREREQRARPARLER